jgi:CrcB protein
MPIERPSREIQRMTASAVLVVAAGGAVGSVIRFALKEWLSRPGDPFPWPTFLANLIGSLVLGFALIACRDRPTLLQLLGVGFCGGLTTFSTFGVETIQLLQQNRFGLAAIYVLASVVAGLGGAWLGMKIASP